ncbi:MAG TPA: carbohydrate porin [Azonexus sp.]|nr:carbohydrate porin [Azonexus sp.]HZW24920.1 carbohydrate porin [Gallionella sp.]
MNNRWTKVALAGLLASNAAFAEGCPDFKQDTLSGDWGGSRSSLCDKGVTVELTHKSDMMANVDGGVARGGVVLMNSEAAASFDLDKIAGLSGASAFVQYHVQHGNPSINAYTGSFAGVTNIETGTSTGQFFQAWVQQEFDNLSVLAGLYAVDSEFYVTDTSGLFLQPPYGMSAEMAQTGRNGPPVFPMGALGLRVKYAANNMYLQAAVTDGVPGNPNNPHGTQIRFDRGDGSLAVAEFGYTPETAEGQYNKTAVGLWRYTARAADLDPAIAELRTDQGAYIVAERTLMAEQGNPAQGLSGFVRFGFVNKNVYQTDWSGSLGLNYQGLFDGRDDDAAGIAVTNSHASAKYRLLNASESSETIVEMTYRMQLQPWLALQPSLQYIANPNMDPALKDAWVVGARIEAAF